MGKPSLNWIYSCKHGCVDVNRKTVNANIGITCIREDYYGKKIQLGTNVSEKGEKMFSSVSVE